MKSAGAEIESNSGFQNAFDKLGNIAKVGGAAIASGIAVGAAGLTALTGKMLQSGAQLEQQLGGSEAVFGAYAQNIQTIAQTAYKNMGLSQNEFLQGANRMGSLFQGAGFTVQESMKMSSESMQRASDIASIMGIDTTAALEAVTGMAKGNFTMMDNLGVAMNDTAIQAYALSKGINKTTQQMSIQEKVGLAQQMFMQKTAKYAGNYAKENDTLAGSINTTKKAFDDFLSGGGNIQNFIDSLINTIKIAVPQITKILPSIVTGLGEVLSQLGPALSAALPTLLPALISAVQGLLNSLVAALPSILQILVGALPQFIDAFVQIFIAIVQALPQIITVLTEAIPTIINAIVAALTNPVSLTAILLGAVQLFLALVQAIPVIITALVDALPVILRNIVTVLTSPQFREGLKQAGITLFRTIVQAIPNIFESLKNALRDLFNIAKDYFAGRIQEFRDAGANIIGGFINGIRQKFEDAKKAVKDGLGSIRKLLPFSPAKEGPFSGKGWTLYSGRSLMQGLADGIRQNASLPQLAIDKALGGAQLSLAGATSASAAPVSNTSISINGDITLGDQSAVTEFFSRLNRNNELAQKGMAVI